MTEVDNFEARLRNRLSDHFRDNSKTKYGDIRLFFKAVTFIFILISSYTVILIDSSPFRIILAYSLFSLCNLCLAINIGHEAIHNTLSKNKFTNSLGKACFNLAGVSGSIWGTKHLKSHHVHTNIPELDCDFQQNKLIRLEKGYPKSKWHVYQPYYIPILYLLYTFHWTYIKDFMEASLLKKNGEGQFLKIGQLLITKSLYIMFLVIIPFLINNDIVYVYGFLISYATSSLFFALFLIPIHINDYTAINTNSASMISFNEQLSATPNYATNNYILNFILGGFNHHACHHLFPDISHVHYPDISKIMKELSLENETPYLDLSLSQLLKSHFRQLNTLAKIS